MAAVQVVMSDDPQSAAKALDLFLLALAIWREARGESYQAQLGVAYVIINRAKNPRWWGGPDIASVVLRPYQFTSFLKGDPNATKFPSHGDPAWASCWKAALSAYLGAEADPTKGATSYYSGSSVPPWAAAVDPIATIGPFKFFAV
jgi:spore germination cell wall hydrolase CwlJ-like protein